MTASDLSSSLNAAIAAADFGARLVIWGIAVEAIDLIVKCGENERFCKWFGDPNRFEEMNLKRLKKFSEIFHPWTLAIEIASFALVVYGLSIEVSGSNEAYRISDQQTAILNTEAGEARKTAGIAEREAGQAMERTQVLVQSNLLLAASLEELRSNNIVLDEQLSPRVIEESKPAKRLEKFSGVKAAIIVASGGDCPSIAAQISAILQMAKWECSVFPTSKPVPVGISVNFCFTNEDLDAGYAAEVQNGWRDVKAGRALVSELNAAGVDAIENDMGADRITTLKINGLVILVGAKPILLDADIFRHEKIMQSVKTLPELYKEQDKSFDLQNKKYKTVNGGGMFGGERVKLP
jgi:hypothetical protein